MRRNAPSPPGAPTPAARTWTAATYERRVAGRELPRGQNAIAADQDHGRHCDIADGEVAEGWPAHRITQTSGAVNRRSGARSMAGRTAAGTARSRCGRVPLAAPVRAHGQQRHGQHAMTTAQRTALARRRLPVTAGSRSRDDQVSQRRADVGGKVAHPGTAADDPVQRQLEGVKGRVARAAVQTSVTVPPGPTPAARCSRRPNPLARRTRSAARTRIAPARRLPTPHGLPPARRRTRPRILFGRSGVRTSTSSEPPRNACRMHTRTLLNTGVPYGAARKYIKESSS